MEKNGEWSLRNKTKTNFKIVNKWDPVFAIIQAMAADVFKMFQHLSDIDLV
jgi:phosphomevalonate kinase